MNYWRSLVEVLNHPLNKDSKPSTFLRIMWWKCNQALFHFPAIVQLTPEAQCICHPERSYAGQVIDTKFPEYAEMKLIYNIVRSEDVFIDVGADIGTYSLIAASKITTGNVYAFEPKRCKSLFG